MIALIPLEIVFPKYYPGGHQSSLGYSQFLISLVPTQINNASVHPSETALGGRQSLLSRSSFSIYSFSNQIDNASIYTL